MDAANQAQAVDVPFAEEIRPTTAATMTAAAMASVTAQPAVCSGVREPSVQEADAERFLWEGDDDQQFDVQTSEDFSRLSLTADDIRAVQEKTSHLVIVAPPVAALPAAALPAAALPAAAPAPPDASHPPEKLQGANKCRIILTQPLSCLSHPSLSLLQ